MAVLWGTVVASCLTIAGGTAPSRAAAAGADDARSSIAPTAPQAGASARAAGPAPGTLSAEEPVYLTLETRLELHGAPADVAEIDVAFHLSETPNGEPLWSQGPQRIPLRDGHLRAILGDGGSPLALDLLREGRWIRIECDGCTGRTRFPVVRRGGAVSLPGVERPSRPGPAAAKPYLRNRLIHDRRAYPTGIVPGGRIAKLYAAAGDEPLRVRAEPGATIESSPATLTQGAWSFIGPSKVTGGQTAGSPRMDVSGRVNSVAVHPSDPNVVYACGAQGGVWKSVNAGLTWTPLTDQLPSLATGAVALAASDPNLVWLGTGEANLSFDSYWGAGVFRSNDAGGTFAATAALDPNRSTTNAAAVAAIDVHPADPDAAIVAVGTFQEGNRLLSGGVYRTDDGGASWARTLGPGLPAGVIAASDVRRSPGDPNVVWAALGYAGGSANNGVFRSSDGGLTFTKSTNGFPTTNVGRINLAIAPSNPQIVYAAVHDISTDGLLGVWRTLDGGASWSARNANGAACGVQCWYDLALAVSPTNSDVVFFGGVSLYRSTNGAGNFSNVMSGVTGAGGIHVDQHALVFAPSNPGQLWIGNDGGVWRTDDANASTINWINRNGNLGLLQFQSVALPPNDPNIAYGGTQDNGTNKYTGGLAWPHVDDGDGGQTAVDHITPATVYHTFFGVSFRRSDNSGLAWSTKQSGLSIGDRSSFYVPVEMDPTNPAVLYLGSYRLYRTASRGDAWSAISGDLTVVPGEPSNVGVLTAIGVGADDGNVLYTGSDNAQINVTTNVGGVWTNRTSAPLPNRSVTSLAVLPADANTAYVTYSGFNDPNTGDGHVFRTTDLGATWTDVSANLPDVPVSQITIDPAAPQMLYLSTDIGPYVSSNAGQTWLRYSDGFPNVAVFETAVQQPNLLFAATHGRGVFQAFGCRSAGVTDADADGVADFCDNCALANASQADADRDGSGPPCDCADADPARHPGAAEICNTIDDDCDGETDEGWTPPGLVGTDLAVVGAGDLSWGPAPLGQAFNVYRGTIPPTPEFGTPSGPTPPVCLAADLAVPAHQDAETPMVGASFYYLVSARNCVGEGGLSDPDVVRTNPDPCP